MLLHKNKHLLWVVQLHLFNDVLALRIRLDDALEVGLLDVVQQLVRLLREFVRKWFLLRIVLLASTGIVLLSSVLFVLW